MSHSNAPLHRDDVRGLVLPVVLGASVAAVMYLVLFAVILWIAFARFDYAQPFGTSDALAVGLQGALALGLTCALGAWLTRRRAQLRDVSPLLAHRAALLAGVLLVVVVLLLGIAPALRLVTAPVYLLAVIAGTWLGSSLGARR